ncbi:MAG: helical backbone metal receptor [bacterium]
MFDSFPKRIISLAPNITETLFALRADSQVVGVTDLCDFPPEAGNKTKTGSYISPNFEVMLSLNPDLIIINVEKTSNPTYQALKNMGLKIFVSNARNLQGIYKMIADFGKLTGKVSAADSLARRLNTVQLKYENNEDERAQSLILISVNPLMTTNGNTFINDIIKLTPLLNIYKDQTLDYPNINYEDAISKNPTVIVFPTDTNDVGKTQKFLDEIKRQFKSTPAVKENEIILIDENIMFRPGPRVFEAVKIIREKFYNAKGIF